MISYIFTGFRQADAVRQFAFDCVVDDRPSGRVTVGADLSLARKYHILMQDLPLLCRRLLETGDGLSPVSLIFTEADMAAVQTAATKAVVYRKPQKRATDTTRPGQAWR